MNRYERNRQISAYFKSGRSTRQLARRFRLTERWVRAILQKRGVL